MNKISNQSLELKILTEQEIESIKNIKNSDERLQAITEVPFALPYVLNNWASDNNISQIVKLGVELYPNNITKLGKGGVLPTQELVDIAVVSNPEIIFSLSDSLKNMISEKAFFSAFVKNPDVCASNAKVLKKVVKRKAVVSKNGEQEEKKIATTVRSECLKALRLASGVSRYHKGYDDFAVLLAEELIANNVLKKYESAEALATKLPTIVNIMIKNQNIKLYAMPAEVWKLNNYKTLYLAVKESCKANSKIKDILEYIPFDLLPEKVTKKVVAIALQKNPQVWLKLDECNLEYLKQDGFIQYVMAKSCIENKQEQFLLSQFKDENLLKALSKYQGVLKRKENKVTKAKSGKMSKVFKTEKKNKTEQKQEQLQFDL